jgi:hypothetical protein
MASLCMATAAWCALFAQTSREAFTLLVLDENGRPLASAQVSVSRDGVTLLEQETGPEGVVRISSVRMNAVYRVAVERAGYVDASSVRLLSQGGKEIQRMFPASSIHGRIRTVEGSPVAGVQVSTSDRAATVSEEDGSFRLSGLLPGTHRLRVASDESHPQAQGRGSWRLARPFEAQPSPGEDLQIGDVIVQAGGSAGIRGVVEGIPEKWGNGRALVAAFGEKQDDLVSSTLADAGGKFELANIPQGEYRVLAWGPVYDLNGESRPPDELARFAIGEVAANGGPMRLALRPGSRWKLQASVSDGCWGMELLSLKSSAGWPSSWFASVSMNASEVLPPGHYRLDFPNLRRECIVTPKGFNVFDNQQLPIDVALAKGSVSGTAAQKNAAFAILDATGGSDSPVSFVSEVDAKGAFRFSAVPPRRYTLRLVRDGAVLTSKEIALKDGESLVVGFNAEDGRP